MASPNPGLLAALLKTGRLTGVLRWKVNLTNENLKIEANIAKWIGYFLNLSDTKSLEDCFALISTEFDLPKLNLANFVQLISEKFQQQKNTGDQKILLACDLPCDALKQFCFFFACIRRKDQNELLLIPPFSPC